MVSSGRFDPEDQVALRMDGAAGAGAGVGVAACGCELAEDGSWPEHHDGDPCGQVLGHVLAVPLY